VNVDDISYVGVGFFLDGEVGERLVNISERFASQCDSWWRLSQGRFPPHISCWLAYMPSSNLPDLQQIVAEKCRTLSPFHAHVKDAHQEASGHVLYRIREQSRFKCIHSALLDVLNPLREGYIHPKYTSRLADMSRQERANVQSFGTRFVDVLFSAHITVAVTSQPVKSEISAIAPTLNALLDMNRITVWRQATSGVAVEVLDAYDMGHVE